MATELDRRGAALIEGPIARTLLTFALPTIGSNIFQTLNGSVNAIWVGQFLGKTRLAATSNANLIMFMVFALVFGFGTASTILVGQCMGRGDVAGMRRAVGTGAGLFLAMGLVVAIIGWLIAPVLLRAVATPADVYRDALVYLRAMLGGLPAGLLILYVGMVLRGTGDSLTPLLFMIPATVIDAGLNPILILGLGPVPRIGVMGSGLATTIANYVSLAALVAYVYARDLPVRLRGAELRHLVPAPDLVRLILAKGVPIGLQMTVMSVSSLMMIVLVNREGTTTIAAYGASNQLWTYIQMPAIAIGIAVSAMAAQNIGAGRWDRVGRIAVAGTLTNLVLTGVLVAAAILLDQAAMSLFLGRDANALAIARHLNLLASWSFIPFGMTMVLSSVTRASGATLAPLLITAVALLPGRLGAAYLLLPVIGADAIWWSFPVGSVLSLVLTFGYYRYGGWRGALVMPPSREEGEERAQGETKPAARLHLNM